MKGAIRISCIQQKLKKANVRNDTSRIDVGHMRVRVRVATRIAMIDSLNLTRRDFVYQYCRVRRGGKFGTGVIFHFFFFAFFYRTIDIYIILLRQLVL